MNRLARIALWIAPVLYCLWLYRHGLQTWFQQDDFAWLGLPLHIQKPSDLWAVLFKPMAQGTIRPWSERLFFLVFSQVSWLDPRPFHAWVFLTACGVLFLLQWLVRRLTGSVMAGVLAPVIWLSGVGPANPMSWLSSYNQVLASFVFLAGIGCLIRATESPNPRRWWVAQWGVFLFGFGVLEIHVVYPALALLYALLFARSAVRRVIWMFPVSLLYIVLNLTYIPKPTVGPYARHFDLSVFTTLFKYCGLALSGGQVIWQRYLPSGSWLMVAWLLGVCLLVWAAWAAWRCSRRAGIFGMGWFVIVLAPTLPLRDHVTEYYLASAGIGLAVAFAAAAAMAWSAGWTWRAVASCLLAVHLIYSLQVNMTITRWRYDRGLRIRGLVKGLERAVELHPGKILLLTGIDSELFWSCLLDSPARLFGAYEVYLAPGQEENLDSHADLGDVSRYVADPGLAGRALYQRSAVAYQFDGSRLRNITKKYTREIPQVWLYERPRLIDAAHPAFAADLGSGWNRSDGTYRWMTRRAVVRLAAPKDGDTLFLSAYLPQGLTQRPTSLTVHLNGVLLGVLRISPDDQEIDYNTLIPKNLIGANAEVVLEVDQPIRLPGDQTEYGLAFGKIGLR